MSILKSATVAQSVAFQPTSNRYRPHVPRYSIATSGEKCNVLT